MSTTTDLATSLRADAATLAKAWPLLHHPTKPGGVRTRSVPGSRLPGNGEALSLRVELVRDLAFWLHAIVDDLPDTLEQAGHTTVHAGNVPAALAVITHHAAWLSGWEFGPRLATELEAHARDARRIAWPKVSDTIALGDCPNQIGAGKDAPACGTPVRASAHHPGDIRCKGCGLTDTIDGWMLRIVGNEPLVTAEQLIPLLRKRMGIVATRSAIRGWKRRGIICSSGSVDGVTVFDRQAVFAALVAFEAARDGRVGA